MRLVASLHFFVISCFRWWWWCEPIASGTLNPRLFPSPFPISSLSRDQSALRYAPNHRFLHGGILSEVSISAALIFSFFSRKQTSRYRIRSSPSAFPRWILDLFYLVTKVLICAVRLMRRMVVMVDWRLLLMSSWNWGTWIYRWSSLWLELFLPLSHSERVLIRWKRRSRNSRRIHRVRGAVFWGFRCGFLFIGRISHTIWEKFKFLVTETIT